MAVNQTEYAWREQRSVMKFLPAEKCKPCEIYRRFCDVYREACYRKSIYKWSKDRLTTVSLSRKDRPCFAYRLIHR